MSGAANKEDGAQENPLSMSDEDFLNQTEPEQEEIQDNPDPTPTPIEKSEDPDPDPAASGDAAATEDPGKDQPKVDAEEPKEKTPAELAAERAAEQAEEKKGKLSKDADDKSAEKPADDKGIDPSGSKEPEKKDEKVQKSEDPKTDPKPDTKPDAKPDSTPVDYKAFHDQIMAPFNANGKQIQVKNPAEAISLMQMGANYTRKLQELAPHRKILTMLGNHDLLDESKLSLFIALDKGDPEAVKKFIVDKGIDPLDIDTKTESTYQDGSYQVSDQEVAFRTQLEDLSTTDEGKQTLADISKNWDQTSKDMLWHQPQVMSIIHEQRENGIYAKITDEMDRRRTLGQIPANTPFLEAYKVIGDELHEQGAFGEIQAQPQEQKTDPIKPEQGQEPAKEGGDQTQEGAERPANGAVVATRPASPRPTVDNGDKAGAAAATRSSPGKAKEATNFLSMNDDDFLRAANLEGRV